jgi:hypothetical protein
MEYLRNNPHYKSGETMSVDSAVWYIEAALNYTYARAGNDFANVIGDSAKITIPAVGGEIAMDDLPVVYEQFLDSLRAKYYSVQSENKKLIMVNMVPGESTESGTEVMMYSATGEGAPTYIYGLFDSTDYWYWGYYLGKCDIYQGQNVGEDATTQLQYRINHPDIAYPPGAYFTDEFTTDYFSPWDYPDPNNPYGYYRLFAYEFTQPPTEHPCLSHEEMNYYLYEGVVYIMEDNKPDDKCFISGEVIWDIFGGVAYCHRTRYTYGIIHISEDPPDDL